MRARHLRTVACLASLVCVTAARADPTPDPGDFAQIAHGRVLFVEGDCAACHDAPDGTKLAGGRPLHTPLGTLLAPNITPDRTTGIGQMTADQFIDVLQKGRGRNGTYLYPGMPYVYYTNIRHDDVLALYAYLRTVTPVRHKVEPNQLPFPFDIRPGMIFWNLLFFRNHPWQPDPARGEAWNNGAYLVNGLAHCGACHNPHPILGGERQPHALQGGVLQRWMAPDLTGNTRHGLGGWSEDDIVTYLRSGHNRFAGAAGPMGEEVHNSSSQIPSEDLQDIAVYLKSLPASANTAAPVPTPSIMAEGAAIYRQECSACHAPGGTGAPGLFPRLAGGAQAQQRNPTSVIRVILQGARTVQTQGAPTGPAMPSFGWVLSDADVAAVASYVGNAWNNHAATITADTVGQERIALKHAPPE